jgi:hypothetical protein
MSAGGPLRLCCSRAARFSVLCLLALALSGCGLGAPVESSSPELVRAVSGEAEAASSVAPRTPPVGGAQAALEADLTNFKDRLLGLASDRIDALFGAPALARAEPPATIWQYRQPTCTIDVFMFEAGGVMRVDHVDVRGARARSVDESACFRANLQKKIAEGARGG